MAVGEPSSGDATFPEEYLKGIALFNDGDYFEAHEAWEELWLVSTGEEKRFLQGLIQCAAALHHIQLQRLGAARRTFERSRLRFEGLPARYMSLDISDFVGQIETFISRCTRETPVGDGDPSRRPAIRLCPAP
ncbi:MAG: DUF309 domain-containing protein [Acidobacteria bacterium]|nr:DUF309 domain-containing protein [Acidobacteriota bacterium]